MRIRYGKGEELGKKHDQGASGISEPRSPKSSRGTEGRVPPRPVSDGCVITAEKTVMSEAFKPRIVDTEGEAAATMSRCARPRRDKYVIARRK